MSQNPPQQDPSAPRSDKTEPDVSSPASGVTTHDLRQQALEAIKRLRETTSLPTTPPSTIHEASTISSASDEALGPLPPVSSEPSAQFTPQHVLGLLISETNALLLVDISKQAATVGRSDQMAQFKPEVDLSDHGAYRLGLSRRHAQFVRHESNLVLIDLGSRNGTSVNGERMPPRSARVIQDGDEVSFGNLALRLTFRRKSG